MKKVMVAMSGGVDSSAAALLLLEKGYTLMGVTLKMFDQDEVCRNEKGKTCCSLTDVEDARAVADKLGFPHFVFNMKKQFQKNVIDRFVASYGQGETPNPCIDCNRYIKFGDMLEKALALENDYLATGHYARIEFDESAGRYLLKKALDEAKDQSYVLYHLTQEQLGHVLLPLGNRTKPEIRSIAAGRGLINAQKPDSQDICFVPDGDYARFIEQYTGHPLQEGEMMDREGNRVGSHLGIERYTIGQRKGLGIAFGKPAYVIRKDAEKNQVIVGDEAALFTSSLTAREVNLISIDRLEAPKKVMVKTRYKQKEQEAIIRPGEQNDVIVEFTRPQRAVTPGQAVVFYDGDVVVGGGTIADSFTS